jgi:hypothetical protein
VRPNGFGPRGDTVSSSSGPRRIVSLCPGSRHSPIVITSPVHGRAWHRVTNLQDGRRIWLGFSAAGLMLVPEQAQSSGTI